MLVPNKELLIKYFSGHCSEEEEHVVELYLSLEIDKDYINECLAEISHDLETADSTVVTLQQKEKRRAKFQEIKRSKELNDTIIPKIHKAQSRNISIYRVYAAVASVIVILLFAGYYAIHFPMQRTAYISLATGAMDEKKIILPDGSKLWLSANTEIRYEEDFGARNRNIEVIDGEAYFDVIKNDKLPFIVKAKSTTTRVLGTAFTITSYRQLGYTDIQVNRGKVNVQAAHQNYTGLTIGDAIHLDEKTMHSNPYKFDRGRFDPESRHVFLQSVSFEELALRIDQIYGYRLVASSPDIKTKKYTIEITKADTIDSLLSNISWLHHGTYEIKGKEVVMY
ncbi:FecR family protein [Sphingobacterium yanglingense]|uniref:FecR family protein n=1 Tax=Sphingobacterium yanglingense TaxID=1437280 RepID=A0A4R6W4F9_9SPHI|nr:FecR family protein [Sphingobacterium yanglingense]TDQ73464.1 FecR family protein [Sphingobacterium yanglingense]